MATYTYLMHRVYFTSAPCLEPLQCFYGAPRTARASSHTTTSVRLMTARGLSLRITPNCISSPIAVQGNRAYLTPTRHRQQDPCNWHVIGTIKARMKRTLCPRTVIQYIHFRSSQLSCDGVLTGPCRENMPKVSHHVILTPMRVIQIRIRSPPVVRRSRSCRNRPSRLSQGSERPRHCTLDTPCLSLIQVVATLQDFLAAGSIGVLCCRKTKVFRLCVS